MAIMKEEEYIGNSRSSGSDLSKKELDKYIKSRRAIVASNRGPIQFSKKRDGTLVSKRGAGGLVTAVTEAFSEIDAIWIAAAMNDADREASKASKLVKLPSAADRKKNMGIKLLRIDPEIFKGYYNSVSNRYLWFLNHYMWEIMEMPTFDDEFYKLWYGCYHRVNDLFSQNIVDIAADSDKPSILLLNDYHLYLVGGYVRNHLPSIPIAHFIHTPWPQGDYFTLLPEGIRGEIIDSLLSCDIVGFHTKGYAQNFIDCCHKMGLETDSEKLSVIDRDGERQVMIRNYPISVDAEHIIDISKTKNVAREKTRLLKIAAGRKILLRSERIDPAKNIMRGLMAFEHFLKKNPDLRERVVFLMNLYPSRVSIDKYRNYMSSINNLAFEINEEYGDKDSQPVVLDIQDNYDRSLAGYCIYDAIMINSLFDGMNLASKEAAVLNERNGIILLSEKAGAYEELKEAVIPVFPLDIKRTSEDIRKALTMKQSERKIMNESARKVVMDNGIRKWVFSQVKDLREVELNSD